MSDPAEYAAWYGTSRGAWIGHTEAALLREMLALQSQESLLDVGCGTGYFTTRLARSTSAQVIGLDPNRDWLRFAKAHSSARFAWVAGRGEALPFPAASFDCTVSVTALCFMADPARALAEIVRVTRRRFALGLLNRRSLLWRQKGRDGGVGAYQGAHWHTLGEVRRLIASSRVAHPSIRTAVFLPGGGGLARVAERLVPSRLPVGAFLAVVGDLRHEGE